MCFESHRPHQRKCAVRLGPAFMLQMCPLDDPLCRLWQATIQVPTNRHDSRGFLEHIPQRLGRNKALHLCARAFTGAMASARSGKVAVQALTDYGSGMKALRASLMNPETAKTAETLVATYLLGLCQAYLGDTDTHYAIHMHGLAMLVEQTSLEEWQDPFHGEVLISAAFGLVCLSPLLPRRPAQERADMCSRCWQASPSRRSSCHRQ